eukprot:COSAG01_NODE_12550_length_1715_cov_1.424168_3_plen_72_part_00
MGGRKLEHIVTRTGCACVLRTGERRDRVVEHAHNDILEFFHLHTAAELKHTGEPSVGVVRECAPDRSPCRV